jgi:16S rRNA (adenine1518-N6/adenine1519-N6)-dimethyltransferase
VLTQWRARAAISFDVPARAFTPQPKVNSAVVRIEPRPDAMPLPVPAVETVTAAAFGQRRKMLRSSLRRIWPEPEAVLAETGIAPTLRAEQLPVEAFLRLAGLFAARRA